MKKITTLFVTIIIFIISLDLSIASVTVTGSNGVDGVYHNLKFTFAAINSSPQTGANIDISISGESLEDSTGAVLNQGTWASIYIHPSGGAATVFGDARDGNPLVDFNGADNVTIDGLNTSGNSLTFINTSTHHKSGTSTIRFYADAFKNVITRCTVLGSSTVAIGSPGGNIVIGASSLSTGNDSITISYCDIGPAIGNLPTKGIFISGTTTNPTSRRNNWDTIRNCNFYDCFSDSNSSAGVFVETGTSDIAIIDNKFYQTALRTHYTNQLHTPIKIDNPGGNNYAVTGNIIGYSSSSGTGVYSIEGGQNRFVAISIEAGTTTASTLQGNIISNISHSTSNTTSPCIMILVAGGLINIGDVTPNLIGSMVSNGNITFTSGSNSTTEVYGIYLTGLTNGICKNNSIGGITVSGSGTGACRFYAIGQNLNSSTLSITHEGNIIGGTIANSIQNTTTNNQTIVNGFSISRGIAVIEENTIRNLTSAGGNGTAVNSSVCGIAVSSTNTSNYNISLNNIYTLSNLSVSVAATVNGIYFSAMGGTNSISRNLIQKLLVSNNSSTISGISAANGTANFQNNMIQLGLDNEGNSMNTGSPIFGISELNSGNNFYFNSVYVGGNPLSGNSNTFAFSSTVISDPRIYRNNIFYNARSNSGSTGKHYAIRIGGTTRNPTGLSSNHNDIYADGNGAVLGFFNGADIIDLGSWQIITGQDFSSFNDDPHYILPNGSLTTVDLHINPISNTIIESNGAEIISVTDDFDGQIRSGFTPTDIGADAGNFPVISLNYAVNVSGATDNNGTYKTLAAASSAINAANQSGAEIVISIFGNTLEPPVGAVFYQGLWENVLIKPVGGTSRIITGNVNPGSSLISLNGADNMTIDGLNSGGNSLIIINPTFSSVTGTSTIRLINDATNNLITNCDVLGSSIVNFTGNQGGVISFESSAGLVTGNDNNTISFCNIGPAGINLPTKCFGFNGTSNPSLYNSNNTISDCNIFDFFNSSLQSSGIHIAQGNKEINILNNNFYQTSSRTDITGVSHSAIFISSREGNASNNFNISGNFIGGSSSTGNGNYTLIGEGNTKFRGIYISTDDITPASKIDGNIIKNISMTGSYGNSPPSFVGVYINAGIVNTGSDSGNTIGSQSGLGSITFSSNSNLNSQIYGFYNNSLNDWVCSNNNIGSITGTNTDTGACHIFCIVSDMGINKSFTCQNNIIGGNDTNSIQNFSNSKFTNMKGIYHQSSEGLITGNIIRNLTSYGEFEGNSFNSVIGIDANAGNSSNHVISQNRIYSLNNLMITDPDVIGISFIGSGGTNLISRNFIHSLTVKTENSNVYGLYANGGTATFQNNMIQLGLNASGNSMNYGAAIQGIHEKAGTNNFYFNSVYIGGISVYGILNTFAFESMVTSNTRNYRNNIFCNSRENLGAIGKHYAISVAGSDTNPAGLTLNNNVYFVEGKGSVLGEFNGYNVLDLASWQSIVGQDSNSFSEDPHYLNPDGSITSVDLHINQSFPSVIEGNGFSIPYVADDFDGQSRISFSPVDIGADAEDIQTLFANDIRISEARIENQVILLGNSYDVIGKVLNVGINVQSNIPLSYSVNGGSVVGPLNTTGFLEHLETETVVFNDTNSFTPTTLGAYSLKIFSSLPSDEYRLNDTLTLILNVQQKITELPFVETFSNLSNWSVLLENPVDKTKLWELGTCTNPSGSNLDIAATSNCYLGAPGRREILKSPVLDFSSFTNEDSSYIPFLGFYVSYTGYPGMDDSLEVLLSTDNGLNFFSASTVYNKSQTSTPSLATRPTIYPEFFPDSLNQWRHEQIDLSNVAGDSNVIIGFRSKSDFGNREWIDNIIVSAVSYFNSQTVSAEGTFDFQNVHIRIDSLGESSRPITQLNSDRHAGINKTALRRKDIIGDFPANKGSVKILSNNESDNSSGGKLSVAYFPDIYPVPSDIIPAIEENNSTTGATTGDGSRFTPNIVNQDVYFSATYSGNDYFGYAIYDLKIDVSDFNSINDINKVYILKRADRTDRWKCLNTTVSGDTLIVSGLDNFSEFSIGSYESPSININLTMFIEGFYNSSANSQVSDTIQALLRNSTNPYNPVDSAKLLVSTDGTSSLTFSNSPTGTYFLVLKHRNSIETWSSYGVAMTQGSSIVYNFSTAAIQAFGNNMKQVDTSPVRFAIYSGDVNQDGVVDGTDGVMIDNDAAIFNTGYLLTDLNGDEVIDGSDAVIADNNAANFVSAVVP